MFSSGVQGSERAAFADLGTEADFAGEDDCNTVGGGQIFASLHISQGKVVAVDTCASSNACPKTFREVPGVEAALSTPESGASIAPVQGHVYVLRIDDQGSTRAMFKILVVEVGLNNASVTFRYGVLDHRQMDTVDCCAAGNTCGKAPRNLVEEQGPPGPRGQVWPAPDDDGGNGVGIGGLVLASGASVVITLAVVTIMYMSFIRRTPGTPGYAAVTDDA